jgi:hypothetical protein
LRVTEIVTESVTKNVTYLKGSGEFGLASYEVGHPLIRLCPFAKYT